MTKSIGSERHRLRRTPHDSRAYFSEQIWRIGLVVAVVGIPLTIWRAIHNNWRFELLWNLYIAIFVIFMFPVRDKLGATIKSAIVILFFYALGFAGLIWLGMVGTAYLWIIQGTLLAGILFSLRAGIILAVVSVIMIALVGVGYVTGRLAPSIDLGVYSTNLGAWLNFLLVAAVIPTSILYTIGGFQSDIVKLLSEVEIQRDQLENLATHDQLTGLPIVRLAEDRLRAACDDAQRMGQKVALLFVDLDGFKAVNDAYGHGAGDRVLQEVAIRLKTAIRAEDTAARIGGDEFMVILPGLSNAQLIRSIAQRIVLQIAQPISFSGTILSVGASIGIAVFPDHAGDIPGLRRLADETMYRVKRSGKNDFMFFAELR